MTKLENWFYRYNAWSFSKHRLWGLCKRAYYYRYIGTALRESEELDIEKLKMLKNLNSRFALRGKLIHEVIENQIGQYYLGRKMNKGVAEAQYTQRVDQYRETPKETLTEYFNGYPVGKTFFDNIRTDGLDQIGMFFGAIWPQFEDLEYLKHEEFDRFRVGDVKAVVKVDYISKTKDGTLVVSDWKTGADKKEYESDLQLGSYVLWATENYGIPPREIRSELVYLTTGIMRSYEFSAAQLREIKKKITEDFKDMNETYEIEHFKPTPSPRKCLSCQFATVCPRSMVGE
ncbi:MAG: PD-(D/E)XK nuclease family protein [Euryarchaeota archaeon]|nr:PD-(D/E)XK nuclease family protein [Euryarchaeota archaeon]